MGQIIISASYEAAPLRGRISVTQMVGTHPVQFNLKLMHDIKGIISTRLKTFRSLNDAIAHASNYGFLSQNWVTQTAQVPG